MNKTVYQATITGIRPLLMHNGRLADPIDPMAVRLHALTSKRKKVAEDHHAIARAEWEGGLYVLNDRLALPAEMIDATLRDGAKAQRKGKAIVAGVEIEEDSVPVVYSTGTEEKAPADWRKLYDFTSAAGHRPFVDRRGAKVQKARIVRCRARFPAWSLTFRIARYEFADVGEADIKRALEFAGYAVGIGDFRPRFGLFRVDSFKAI